jgi:hypothetical protein
MQQELGEAPPERHRSVPGTDLSIYRLDRPPSECGHRPAGVSPFEVYSGERMSEFLAEDRLTKEEAERLRRAEK